MKWLHALGLLRKPRIVRAELASAPIAIAGGRTAVSVQVEGAGVLIVGDARIRFWNGFSGVVHARTDAPIVVRAQSLVGRDERTLSFVPLPALVLPAAVRAPVPGVLVAVPSPPAARPVHVSLPSITTFPRGIPR